VAIPLGQPVIYDVKSVCMEKTITLFKLGALLCLFTLGIFIPASSQTCTTTATGTPSCTVRSNFFYSDVQLPGCGMTQTESPYSPGEYFRLPVLEGGCYTISTCNNSIDTKVSVYEGTQTTNPFAYNDDNGPECATAQASVVIVPNFTDYASVDVREGNCLAGGSASISVDVRQNNNLTFTSSSADMCEGETRTLSATPAPVTVTAQPGSGDVGTFIGTGVGGTTFTAPIPSGASQTYTVTYTFGYCSTTQDITVFKNPSPSIAGVDQIVCASSTVLSGNVATTGLGTWNVVSGPGTVANTNSPASNLTGLIEDSTTVLTWTISNGPCVPSVDTVTISRESAPTTPLAGNNANVCADSTMLMGNAITVGTGTWSLIGGTGTFTSPNSATTSVTGLGIGPNTFRWTAVNGNCPALTDDVVITRDEAPTMAFAGADQSSCDTFAILAGNAPSVGTGTWTVVTGGGSATSPNNPNTTVTGLTVGNNDIIWSIANGSCPASVDTISVTRNIPPAPPMVNGNTTVCEGSGTQLTATSSATTPSFLWWDSLTAGNTLAATAQYNTGPLNATTTFWVTTTDGSTNCTSDRGPITVTVLPAPAVSLGTDSTVCAGDTVCFDAGSNLQGYVWNTNEVTQVICPTTPGMYWVIVTDSNNCQNSDTVMLNNNPTPALDAGMDVEFCTGTTTTIGEVNPDTSATYMWNTMATTPTLSVSTGGTYVLTATSGAGCDAVDSVIVTERDVPTASFSIDTSNCPIIQFTDNSTDATAWSWDFGNGTGSSIASPSQDYTNSGGGAYNVTLTVTNLCGTDSITLPFEISCLVGIDPILTNLEVAIYPNPSQGTFKVQMSELRQDANIQIFELSGKEVYRSAVADPQGSYEERIDLGDVAQGMYFLRLTVGDYQMTKRLVVE